MEVHRIATETHLETDHAYLRSLTNGRTGQVQLRTADELPKVDEGHGLTWTTVAPDQYRSPRLATVGRIEHRPSL